METINPDDLTSVDVAATALGKSRKTIYEWLEKGKIGGVVIAGTQFVCKSEVDRLSQESLKEGAA